MRIIEPPTSLPPRRFARVRHECGALVEIDDATCDEACLDVQDVVPLNADCVVAAGDCETVDTCETLPP